jgi:hypothetical protein
MSNDPTLVKTEIDDLEQRIQAARARYGVVCEADKDWQDMVRAHAEMQRKLDVAKDHSAEAIESLRSDTDILRNSFERWMARVEKNFTQGTKR